MTNGAAIRIFNTTSLVAALIPRIKTKHLQELQKKIYESILWQSASNHPWHSIRCTILPDIPTAYQCPMEEIAEK